MNEQIQKLWEQSAQRDDIWNQARHEKFAELIVRECVTTLEFHGYDDAVPYVKWMATNKLGVKE